MKLTGMLSSVLMASLIVVVPAAAQEMPLPPKPGPEHELLKMEAGTWDAVVEIMPAPGEPPMKSTGVETGVLGCGGLCLASEFKGEMMPGQTFHGHGTTAYDPAKKKYVGSWTDSMSKGLSIGESTHDPASKTFTGWMEGPDMTGKVAKMKSVVEYKDTGTRVFTMYGPGFGPDGKEAVGMRITYKRRQ
jgi:Protein of unknown function (DUF1579)